MPERPAVMRTYGKTRPAASSSSMIFELSSPPSSPLLSPHASSDHLLDAPATSSSSTPQADKENVPVVKPPFKSHQSTLNGFFSLPPKSKKRPLDRVTQNETIPKTIRRESTAKGKEGFTQMHLTHLPLLHTCRDCFMSYVRGGEDEGLHERHHARVTRGIVWEGLGRGSKSGKGKGKEKEQGWKVVKDDVSFGTKGKGKIIVADGSYGGTKLDDILRTVDTVLSSPPLPPAILDQCRVFLFVTASPAPLQRLKPGFNKDKSHKERIVAVVVAQGIKWAMRVLGTDEKVDGQAVDSGDGVLCDPTRLDTPLGIHRLFTIPSYRSLGLAQMLLDAACRHTVYGCRFDPSKGEVAFSQPTNSGKAVMDKWGQGHVRVFVDDESQL